MNWISVYGFDYFRVIDKVDHVTLVISSKKNLPASRAHSHRALRAPEFLNVALRARSCALRMHLSLFLII